MKHKHDKHWIFHASMWVGAVCILLSFGFVAWKFMLENKMLHDTVVGIKYKNEALQRDVIYCRSKNEELSVGSNEQKDAGERPEVSMCNGDSCLFSTENDVVGLVTVRGFFTKIKFIEGFEGGANTDVECPGFVITNGPKLFIEDFFKEIDFSNSIQGGNFTNHRDEKGRLVITIDPNTLPLAEKQRLNRSTEKTEVELQMVVSGQDRKGVRCESDVDLLRVK